MEVDISQYFGGYKPVLQDFGTIGKNDFTEWKILPIADLLPHQLAVNIHTIADKRNGKGLTTVYVIEKDSLKFIVDGHHTVIAKKLNGQQKVKVKYYKYS